MPEGEYMVGQLRVFFLLCRKIKPIDLEAVADRLIFDS